MASSLDNNVTLCKLCGRSLAGPVNFCPFCGKPPFQKPVQQPQSASIAADVSGAEADVSKSDRKSEKENVVEISQQPTVEHQSENKYTDAAADHSKSSTNHLPPYITTSPPPENDKNNSTNAGIVSPPAREIRTGAPKKSRMGIFAIVALVVVASVVSAYKLKSSSTKLAEVNIVSAPKGAAVAIDSKDAGDTPKTALNLTSGKHTFDFSKKGYQSRSIEISLTEGKNPDVQVTLERLTSSKSSAGEQPGTTGGQPVSLVKPTQPKSITPPMKQAAPSPAKVLEKPMEEKIQDAIALYESKQYTAAIKQFKGILEVVPNNSLAKFYLGKSLEAEKQ